MPQTFGSIIFDRAYETKENFYETSFCSYKANNVCFYLFKEIVYSKEVTESLAGC